MKKRFRNNGFTIPRVSNHEESDGDRDFFHDDGNHRAEANFRPHFKIFFEKVIKTHPEDTRKIRNDFKLILK